MMSQEELQIASSGVNVVACEALNTNVDAGDCDQKAHAFPTERSEQEYFDRNARLGCILFVGNLPFQTPWQHVKDRFQEAGKVRYTDLIADGEGRPKGSALVTMESPDGAQRAIELFNEQLFDGRRLIVRLLEAGRRPPLVQRERMPVYGRGRGMMSTQPQDIAPSRTKVSTENVRLARGGSDFRAGLGRHAGQFNTKDGEWGRRLFVGNLPYDCTNAALRDTFQQVGKVEHAEIRMNRGGKSTGMGTIIMSTQEEARNAINEFDGIEMSGRAMKVGLDNQ